MKSYNLYALLFIATTLSLFACSPQRETSDFLRQVQSNIAYLTATVNYRDSVKRYEKLLQESVYEAQLTTNYQKYRYKFHKYQYRHAQVLLQKQRRLIFFLLVCFIISLIAFFIPRRMLLRHRNAQLRWQEVNDTLQKTNVDLIHKQTLKEVQIQSLVNKLNEKQFWKFDTLLKLLLIKTGLGDNTKITADAVALRFCNAIFGKDSPQPWDIVEEIVEEMYPDLLSFIKHKYSFSDTEYKVAVLSFVGVHPIDITNMLEKKKSINTINSARSSIRDKMGLMDKAADFCTVLRQEYQSSKTH